jgi:hypothetical protein
MPMESAALDSYKIIMKETEIKFMSLIEGNDENRHES